METFQPCCIVLVSKAKTQVRILRQLRGSFNGKGRANENSKWLNFFYYYYYSQLFSFCQKSGNKGQQRVQNVKNLNQITVDRLQLSCGYLYILSCLIKES